MGIWTEMIRRIQRIGHRGLDMKDRTWKIEEPLSEREFIGSLGAPPSVQMLCLTLKLSLCLSTVSRANCAAFCRREVGVRSLRSLELRDCRTARRGRWWREGGGGGMPAQG